MSADIRKALRNTDKAEDRSVKAAEQAWAKKEAELPPRLGELDREAKGSAADAARKSTATDPVRRSSLCRSRRELSHLYLLFKFGFDTAENESCNVCPLEIPQVGEAYRRVGGARSRLERARGEAAGGRG